MDIHLSESKGKVENLPVEKSDLSYILLLNGAFLAVVRVRHSGATADDASTLVRTVVALVADSDQRTGTHVRIADYTLSVALFAQATNGCENRNVIIVWNREMVHTYRRQVASGRKLNRDDAWPLLRCLSTIPVRL